MTRSEPKSWNLKPANDTLVHQLASKLSIPPLVAAVLINRGIQSVEDAKLFLKPTVFGILQPDSMHNIRNAVLRLIQAVQQKECILIFGDNDVDGVTSATLLYQYLTNLGAHVSYFLPRRKEDGHGFNLETIHAALQTASPSLFVAVDCGMSGTHEVEALRQMGIETLIVDHHAPTHALPNAIILNPKLPNNPFPFKELAAVGVTFHLVQAMDKYCKETGFYRTNNREAPNLTNFLDLVCLGTIADVVPLISENRCFVSIGLDIIRKRKRSGIAALLADVSADAKSITERTICYRLAPRINAAGRMGDPNECVALLSAYRFTTAQTLAKSLENYNLLRQSAEAAIISEALSIAQQQFEQNKKIIIIVRENWPQGILGIISSRILDRFYRPTIVIALHNGVGRGSARSPEGFSILECLSRCQSHLEDFGGHNSAAGLNIQESNINSFIDSLETTTDEILNGNELPQRFLDIDAEVKLPELLSSWKAHYVEMLAPYGTSNKEPNFLISHVKITYNKRINRAVNKLKFRQSDATLLIFAPNSFVGNFKVGDYTDIVISPKYAPQKPFPIFQLLACKLS